MGESLTQKTFKGFIWSAAGRGSTALLQVVVLAILARLISIESFGLIQAALIVVGFAKLISQMGIGPALVQRKKITERHVRVGFTFSLGLGIVLGGIIFLSSDLLASFFDFKKLSTVLKFISLLFLFESFITVSSSLLQREIRLKEKALVEIGSYFFGYGIMGIIFGYLGFDYWALIIGIFFQEIIKVISYAILQTHSMLPLWSKQEFKELIYYGGGFTFGKFFNYFALQGDNIVTGRYLGSNALGIYSRAYALMTKPSSLLGESIDKALFPAMAARQNDREKLIKAFINGAKMITFISIPTTFVLIFSSTEIVYVLLGSKWTGVIVPFQVLTVGLVFRMGYKMGDCLCRATGKVYSKALCQFIYAVCMILGTYIGSKWGVVGVSFGALFAITVNYILVIQLSLKILNISWVYYLKKIFTELHIIILLSALFVGVIFLTRLVLKSDLLILLTSFGIYGGIVIVLFYYFSRKLSFLEILPFKRILGKFTKK